MDKKYNTYDFFDMFDDNYEYNYDILKEKGVEKNTYFDYIVSTTTSEYIKKMTGRKILLAVEDYTKNDSDFEGKEFKDIINAWITEHNGSFKDVGDFPDELIILCEYEEDYWIFWNNRGNRSLFGRIDKDRFDSLESFRDKFIESLRTNDMYSGVYVDLGSITDIIEEL